MIELVDAPDQHPEDPYPRNESQRTYKVREAGVPNSGHTVRIRRDPETPYQYLVENLVGGKWHRLLTGETENMVIPFDAAIRRAEAVLL